jgi:DNA repair exonuclease SbcCD ATPase subunit
MRTVNFRKVVMENFCCYKNRLEYEFKNDTIVLVTGPNGVGKSTIFSAVPYTLYGVSPTGLKGEDVVNNEVGKNCYTALEFDIDEDKYLCERYVKNSKLGNTATLKKNTVLIKKGHTEVIAEIERILIPQKLFLNTLLFGQKVKTFFTDLNDTDQKDIFRKVLQLDDYILYYDESSDKLKSFKKELDKTKAEINLTVGLIEGVKNQISQLKESQTRFKVSKNTEIKKLKDEKLEIESQIDENNKILLEFGDEDLNSKSKELNENYFLLKNSIDIINNDLKNSLSQALSKKNEKENEIKNEYSLRNSELTSIKDSNIHKEFSDCQEKLKDIKIELSKIETSLDNVREDHRLKTIDYGMTLEKIKKLQDNLNSDLVICPLCKQEIGKENISHLQKELEATEQSATFVKNAIDKLKEKGIELRDKITIMKEEVNEISNTSSSKTKEIEKEFTINSKENKDKYLAVLSKIDTIYKNMVSSIDEEAKNKSKEVKDKISKVESERDNILKKITEKQFFIEVIISLKNQVIYTENLIKSKSSEKFDDSVLKKSEEKYIELQDNLFDLEGDESDQEDLIEIYDFWKTGYSMSGIPSMLIDEAIPFMNEKIGFYLDQIGGRYIVSFDTLNQNKSGDFKDKISVNVYDTVTKANTRKQFSGGQTRIVDIATILTLRDLQSNIQDMRTNIIILDEIFDSLDSKNIEYVSTVLRKMTKGNSINIISHTQIDQLDVDDTLRFL